MVISYAEWSKRHPAYAWPRRTEAQRSTGDDRAPIVGLRHALPPELVAEGFPSLGMIDAAVVETWIRGETGLPDDEALELWTVGQVSRADGILKGTIRTRSVASCSPRWAIRYGGRLFINRIAFAAAPAARAAAEVFGPADRIERQMRRSRRELRELRGQLAHLLDGVDQALARHDAAATAHVKAAKAIEASR
ncbi:MAG: hypothetical protein AAGN46_01360 [Acidobacteriota bacterium]